MIVVLDCPDCGLRETMDLEAETAEEMNGVPCRECGKLIMPEEQTDD